MLESEHPTVKKFRIGALPRPQPPRPPVLDAGWLRKLCLDLGVDDVGFVEIDRLELGEERARILEIFPPAKTLISFLVRMNRENIRTPARSIANLEFHHAGEEVNETGRRVVAALEAQGIRTMNGAALGFPMEMDRWPGRIWAVAHKIVAVAAGLGRMGIHRNVIHPRFGSFVLLGTVVTEAPLSEYSHPVDFSPCLECKLCVAACPTGAIKADGTFNFSACYTHNYREFMGGFVDWVENIADSPNRRAYRQKVSDAETVSMWQSLGFGPNYKAAYCLSVCPAGEDVIGPYLERRGQYTSEIVRPLQKKKEIVYVIPGSDAEDHVARRFPNKKTKRVGNGLRPDSIASFLFGAKLTFQSGQASGLDVTYHLAFTGEEPCEATFVIREGKLEILEGHAGSPDFKLTADRGTWLRFLAKEASLPWAILTRKIRFRGSPRLLLAFARCFPS
jgi:ferredoxin